MLVGRGVNGRLLVLGPGGVGDYLLIDYDLLIDLWTKLAIASEI